MRRMLVVTVVLASASLLGVARADDKPNPTGTWKYKIMAGGQARETTLKLKLEGEKLTGALVGRNDQETPIEDAKFKDGEVSFKVTRERNGQKTTTKYAGKLSKDTIKGKIESDRNGQVRSLDWEAKRG